MKKFFSNVINDRTKDRKWYNTNYFYATTILFIAAWMLCYFVFKTQNLSSIPNELKIYLNTFTHLSTTHVVINSLMLFLSCIFLERHFGSFCLFWIFAFSIPIANLTATAFKSSWEIGGDSCFTFMLIGVYLMVLLFHFKHYILSKHAIWVFIPLLLNLTLTCFGYADTFADTFKNLHFSFLYQFDINMWGHTYPCVAGFAVGALVMVGELLGNRFGIVEHIVREKRNKKAEAALSSVNLTEESVAPAEQTYTQNMEEQQNVEMQQPEIKPNLPPPPPHIANLQNPAYQQEELPQENPQQPTDNQ